LLIADEPTTALDVTLQAQILDLLRMLRDELHLALLLITHDLGIVAELCDRVYVMYAGQIVEADTTINIFEKPKHPYTQALLAGTLSIEEFRPVLKPIEGTVPDLVDPRPECRFRARCPRAFDKCANDPPMIAAGSGSSVRCWLYG
jgi:peptide/nickel transport system ATP-binding protein